MNCDNWRFLVGAVILVWLVVGYLTGETIPEKYEVVRGDLRTWGVAEYRPASSSIFGCRYEVVKVHGFRSEYLAQMAALTWNEQARQRMEAKR